MTLAEDGELWGIQINNVAEYVGMILRLRLAEAHGLSSTWMGVSETQSISPAGDCKKVDSRFRGRRNIHVGSARTAQMRGQVGHRSDTETRTCVLPDGR